MNSVEDIVSAAIRGIRASKKDAVQFTFKELPRDISPTDLLDAGFLPVASQMEGGDDDEGETIKHYDGAIEAGYVEGMSPEAEIFWSGTFESAFAGLADVDTWEYGSIAHYVKQGLLVVRSLPLLLWAPDLVYPGSRRPRNDMGLFRTPTSRVVSPGELVAAPGFPGARRYAGDPVHTLLPVTRYAAGMGGSLYYGAAGPGSGLPRTVDQETWCGTFYYAEPESTTLLRFRRYLVAPNKVAAVHALELELGRPVSPLLDAFEPKYSSKVYGLAFEHPWMSADQRVRVAGDLRAYEGYVESYRNRRAELGLSLSARETPELEQLHQTLDSAQPGTLKYFSGSQGPFVESTTPWQPLVAEHLLRTAEGLPTTIPTDLRMTPGEILAVVGGEMGRGNAQRAKGLSAAEFGERRYAGRLLRMYAQEDFLDQYLCKTAREAGYDVVLLEGIPGSHQVVAEVLDARLRIDSFDALVYVVGGGV